MEHWVPSRTEFQCPSWRQNTSPWLFPQLSREHSDIRHTPWDWNYTMLREGIPWDKGPPFFIPPSEYETSQYFGGSVSYSSTTLNLKWIYDKSGYDRKERDVKMSFLIAFCLETFSSYVAFPLKYMKTSSPGRFLRSTARGTTNSATTPSNSWQLPRTHQRYFLRCFLAYPGIQLSISSCSIRDSTTQEGR